MTIPKDEMDSVREGVQRLIDAGKIVRDAQGRLWPTDKYYIHAGKAVTKN